MPHLGNFLSGMETQQEEHDRDGRSDLGNFLSGMETFRDRRIELVPAPLGNFLSGMETKLFDAPVVVRELPWKLP